MFVCVVVKTSLTCFHAAPFSLWHDWLIVCADAYDMYVASKCLLIGVLHPKEWESMRSCVCVCVLVCKVACIRNQAYSFCGCCCVSGCARLLWFCFGVFVLAFVCIRVCLGVCMCVCQCVWVVVGVLSVYVCFCVRLVAVVFAGDCVCVCDCLCLGMCLYVFGWVCACVSV